MPHLGNDASSNMGQASKSLTSGAGQETPRQVPQPASAVFQGQILQVLEKAFLHFDLDPRKDWVQCLEEIEIKTKKVDWGEFYGSFYPVVTEEIEVGMMGSQPIYAIVGGHGSHNSKGEDLHGCLEYIIPSTARPPCATIESHLIMDLIITKGEANPGIHLHKYASMFEGEDDQNYWLVVLVVKEGLLSDERLRKLREKHGLSTYLSELLNVKAKWDARKRSNENPQQLLPQTAPRASSMAPSPSPAKSVPHLASTVESELHTPTTMKRTSRKPTTIKSREQYTNLIDQSIKEMEDAEYELGVAERLIAHYRHALAYAEAKKASAQQKILHAQHERKRTMERTSRELAHDLLVWHEGLDSLEDEPRASKRSRTS